VEPALVVLSLLLSLSRACVGNSIVRIGELRYLLSVTLNNADVLVLQDRMQYPLRMIFTLRVPLSLYQMDIEVLVRLVLDCLHRYQYMILEENSTGKTSCSGIL
jgi:hypothetical protein